MANGADEVRSLLKDVALYGSVTANKRKLLWLLGWSQDRAGAWKDLLDHWVEIGEDREKLVGIEIWSNIILYSKVDHSPQPVSAWAG